MTPAVWRGLPGGRAEVQRAREDAHGLALRVEDLELLERPRARKAGGEVRTTFLSLLAVSHRRRRLVRFCFAPSMGRGGLSLRREDGLRLRRQHDLVALRHLVPVPAATPPRCRRDRAHLRRDGRSWGRTENGIASLELRQNALKLRTDKRLPNRHRLYYCTNEENTDPKTS